MPFATLEEEHDHCYQEIQKLYEKRGLFAFEDLLDTENNNMIKKRKCLLIEEDGNKKIKTKLPVGTLVNEDITVRLKRFITGLKTYGLLLLTIFTARDLPTILPPPEMHNNNMKVKVKHASSCATVEDMGNEAVGDSWIESLRVRELIRNHFQIQGASRVRSLSPDQFCKQNFVMGKASEAGFGNEMGKYPFGDYITYANFSFTLKEVKHLWKKNDCVEKYERHLIMRVDDFEKPSQTNVLSSNWRKWKQPIIWCVGLFKKLVTCLKMAHLPNVIGELLRVIISPSPDVQKAVNSVIDGGRDPYLSVHMRMLGNRSPRAVNAVLNCINTTITGIRQPRVVLISDTASLVNDLKPKLHDFTEVLHFDYKKFKGNMSGGSVVAAGGVGFRTKDWGPAPRWVAFVDFFLASRAKHAVISGAQRRVGTTYAQLIAALAATYQLGSQIRQ
ncbi:uncharacterized protein LOC143588600 [Bidens hawaiensis]|uniref:uncharacterized protein LOC143588600 n=1 Tax=Bidens hawaiensis TaxID=980011 RepID=UPI004049C7EA